MKLNTTYYKDSHRLLYKFLSICVLSFICAKSQEVMAQDYQWAFLSGYTNSDQAYTASVDPKSNDLFLGASITGSVDVDPGAGTTIFSSNSSSFPASYIARFNSSGTLVWAKKFNENSTNNFALTKILIDTSGYFYVLGTFSGTQNFNITGGTTNLSNNGIVGTFLAKYRSSDAKLMWAKMIAQTAFTPMSANIAVSLDAGITNNGKIFVIGGMTGIADFDPTSNTNNIGSPETDAAYFVKYDTAGTVDFVKFLVGAIQPSDLKVTSQNEVYISGLLTGSADFDPSATNNSLAPTGTYVSFLAKYDENGNYTWAKKLDSDGTSIPLAHLLLNGSEEPILYGTFNGKTDFDPGSAEKNITSKGSSDAYFAQYNSLGKLSWVKIIGSTAYETLYSLILERDNSLTALITYSGSVAVDVDPGTEVHSVTSGQQAFVHYNANGKYLSLEQFGGSGGLNPIGLVHDTLNSFYLISNFSASNVDFDPGAGTANLSTAGYDDILVAKYTSSAAVTSVFDKKEKVSFKAYPIPAAQSITVDLPENLKSCQAKITNLYGQVIWEGKLDAGNTTIDISQFKNGMYSLEMTNDNYYSSGLIQKMQ